MDDASLQSRLQCIERLSRQHAAIPLTRFVWRGEELHVEQERIRCRPPPNNLASRNAALLDLAALLDEIDGEIVHGDIHRKNVLFDGVRLLLVDWEPALHQHRNGRACWMYTEPFRSLSDHQNRTLTHETDRLGFLFYAFGWLHQHPPLLHPRMLGQVSRGRRRSIAPFPDECWLQSSYADILAQVRGLEPTWRPSGTITL